ncbi:hypothetical protein B0920_15495 [Massilia sp. KIM]|uniref:sialidase family protein n=1 Tax=Massilia sp. KIM TaxID=1955422 RepID=UPI00098FE7E1|nr:sialidase family protein [Massilia sp. KIM]OON60391.1 hypothetical protein B0920_15495 [Massilia sp. KIM]
MPSALLSLLLALVLWLAASPARPAPAMAWEAPITLATGGGTKGPWRQNDSDYDYVDDGTVAFLADGRLAVAWVDQRRKDVLFQTLDADGKPGDAPLNVSRSGASFSWHPRIASGRGKQEVYLIWQEIIFSGGSHGGEILFAASSDGGRSFGAPRNLSNSRGGDGKGRVDRDTWSNGSADIAVASDGTIHVAWTEYDGALWHARSRDGGAGFSPARRIAGDDRLPARAPALATGPSDRVYLAWTVGEDLDEGIRVAQSDDAGASFGRPAVLGRGAGFADAPRIAVDGGGVLHVVFARQSSGAPSTVWHARSADGVTGFAAPALIPAASKSVAYPALALDARGMPLVLAEAMDVGGRARGLLIASWDGKGYSAFAPVPGSRDAAGVNGSQQGLLGRKLALGPEGGVVVVNSALAPVAASRVWMVRGRLRR